MATTTDTTDAEKFHAIHELYMAREQVPRSPHNRPHDATSAISDASNAVRLLGRLEGDAKSLAKRITVDGTWPEEIRQFLRFIRETRDVIEQKHPELMK